ncbi:MAG: hypothetical protein N2645_03610 [Clostridia bacterium]|nr:hypothetical protein [Clostridia bacterium]
MFNIGDVIYYGKYKGIIHFVLPGNQYVVTLFGYLGKEQVNKLLTADQLKKDGQISILQPDKP